MCSSMGGLILTANKGQYNANNNCMNNHGSILKRFIAQNQEGKISFHTQKLYSLWNKLMYYIQQTATNGLSAQYVSFQKLLVSSKFKCPGLLFLFGSGHKNWTIWRTLVLRGPARVLSWSELLKKKFRPGDNGQTRIYSLVPVPEK